MTGAFGDPAWEAFLRDEARVSLVNVGEHRLRVVEVGAGEPVLLIHGWADSAYAWRHNLRPLAQAGFRALAFDLPGCGESALPAAARFGVDDLAGLAVALLDALDIERAHMIGSSMGGGIVLQLAVHYAGRLRRAVAVAPTCYHPPFRPFVPFALRCLPIAVLMQRLAGPWMVRPFLRKLFRDRALLTPAVVAEYRRAFARPAYVPTCVAMARDFWNDAFFLTAGQYHRCTAPLHLIWGAHDAVIRPATYALRLAAESGADLTIIAAAGHEVQQEQPGAFNRTVVRFLTHGNG